MYVRAWHGSFASFAFKTWTRPLGYRVLSRGGADLRSASLVDRGPGWFGQAELRGVRGSEAPTHRPARWTGILLTVEIAEQDLELLKSFLATFKSGEE